MQESVFTISTPEFEGPLSLLLDLVQKRKVFINDISLAEVTDEFIDFIKEDDETLSQNASFIAVAATLLLIKSRSLLPNFTLTAEEEESAEELKERLQALEILREKSQVIESLFGKNILALRKATKGRPESIFIPDERINKELLSERVKFISDHLPQREMPERVSVKQTIRLEDVLSSLMKRVKKHVAYSFREFAKIGEAPKQEVVVRFVALLELVKQGFLEAEQKELAGDIELRHQEVAVPNYSGV